VKIGAANGCDFYFYQDFVSSVGRDWDFADLRARRGLWLDDGEHSAGHRRSPLAVKVRNANGIFYTVPQIVIPNEVRDMQSL
jgi:hypothetical protein